MGYSRIYPSNNKRYTHTQLLWNTASNSESLSISENIWFPKVEHLINYWGGNSLQVSSLPCQPTCNQSINHTAGDVPYVSLNKRITVSKH